MKELSLGCYVLYIWNRFSGELIHLGKPVDCSLEFCI